MARPVKEKDAYRKVLGAFRRQRGGATVADIAARTALPLAEVKELVPRAADEYSARLEVTQSGEICYSFPRGFRSRFRGPGPALARFFDRAGEFLKKAGVLAFKVWIMVMLVGYFALFMLLALAAVLLSLAARSSGSNGRSRGSGLGGFYLGTRILDLVIRLWFYSELTRSLDGRPRRSGTAGAKKNPLHRAIFSFVFGDGDPNQGWEETEKKALIAYIQSHRGVISLPEYMVITGKSPAEAESALMAFCAAFNGSPEATGEGTVVYRFDELLRRADKADRSFGGASAPLKRLKSFSKILPRANRWFARINGVNLVFGGYFLWNALSTGAILTELHLRNASFLYGMSYLLLGQIIPRPLPFITWGLGLVPLVFSFLFWLIPALRALSLKGENEGLKRENFRKMGYGRIWSSGRLETGELRPAAPECLPQNPAAAEDRVVKDMGLIAVPEVRVDSGGLTVYDFSGLEREKTALENYRASLDPGTAELGATVFDSDSPVV
jgi:hypothetical protein